MVAKDILDHIESGIPTDTTPAEHSPLPTAYTSESPAVTAHISMLQGIINRLAGNSASCKTWCIALVSALVSLMGATHLPAIIWIALVPVLIFGFLDAGYLAQERAFRALYKRLVEKLHKGEYMLADTFDARAPLTGWARIDAYFSWSVAPMYVTLIVLVVVAYSLGWLNFLALPAAHT